MYVCFSGVLWHVYVYFSGVLWHVYVYFSGVLWYVYMYFSGVYLCGHSAGGHLAAMLLAHNWMQECMVSPSLVKGTQPHQMVLAFVMLTVIFLGLIAQLCQKNVNIWVRN